MCSTALQGFYLYIQFHPVELAVFRVWVDAYDGPFKPALALPEFGIKKHFDAVAYVESVGHFIYT